MTQTYLFESEEGTVVDLLTAVGRVVWRGAVAFRATGRGTGGGGVGQSQLAAALQALDLVTYLLGHALWGIKKDLRVRGGVAKYRNSIIIRGSCQEGNCL